jgi:hypothetical protein
MESTKTPNPITYAAATMLAQYHPGLTAEKLQAALQQQKNTGQPKEQLVTRKEAGASLRLSLPTIDRMLAAGELTRIKVRERAFIRLSEIEAIINGTVV